MDTLPYGTPPRWWGPQLSPFWIRLIRTPRVLWARKTEGLWKVEVQGLEHVRAALAEGKGVLITPKHAGHADAYTFLAVGDRLGVPFHYLVGWQVFRLLRPIARQVLRWHGCFSINREANDFRAFRQAVEVVQDSPHPLVVFAEGEVYHNEAWVVPFRPGPAAIALAAAKKGRRPVVCIPAAVRYDYLEDPTPRLLRLMKRLERKIGRPPPPGTPLAARVKQFAEALVSRYEQTYLGRRQSGPFPGRVLALADALLRRLEAKYGAAPAGADVPDRATHVRQQLIPLLEGPAPGDPRRRQAEEDLALAGRAVELFSYAHDYDAPEPTREHVGEVLDKFEEDVLGAPTAGIRAAKRATVRFGPPVAARRDQGKKEDARALTETLHDRVQQLLDELNEQGRTRRGTPRNAAKERGNGPRYGPAGVEVLLLLPFYFFLLGVWLGQLAVGRLLPGKPRDRRAYSGEPGASATGGGAPARGPRTRASRER